MGELHDVLADAPGCAELRQIDALDAPRTDPADARPEPVDLASHTQTGRRREQRERGDDQAESPADNGEPQCVRERRAPEEHHADHVREARRTAVLDRTLAEAGLDHIEVEQAGQTPAPPEAQADRELSGEKTEDRP